MEKDTKIVDETIQVTDSPAEETVQNEGDSSNQVEEKKENPVLKYLGGIWYSFIDGFRYNHCKLPGILIALPGLFLGFFLGFHQNIISSFLDVPYSGFYMFMLVLFGCINIFNGVTVSSKKNLSSIIVSTVCSLVIITFGILWIYSIFHSYAVSLEKDMVTKFVFDYNHYMSIACVILSILCSVSGCVLAFIFRDKNYKKVNF